ncbi:dihydroorotate dehydrogenase [Candidatus Micrarchaeota archaeon]|nr:dihydroorotate dehydrogenase [Candidatus Micrarchaeota archaeon]
MLKTKLMELELENPLILASGILGTSKKLLERIGDAGAGALTTKSISIEPREGHNSPIITDFGAGLINAVGYANPGIDGALEEFKDWNHKSKLIFSIVGKTAEEFGELAKRSNEINVDAVEVVLSCPHTPGYGLMAGQGTLEHTYEITKAVRKKTKKPLIIKLSPSVPGVGELAKEAERAGADIINMGNSGGPGMSIDIERRKPVLGFRFGGISGPGLKPLAIRCVYDVYEAVKIPIIGTGGISNYKDAIEIVMAGATGIGIGTAVYYGGTEVFGEINKGMEKWLEEHGCSSLKEIKGVAHE